MVFRSRSSGLDRPGLVSRRDGRPVCQPGELFLKEERLEAYGSVRLVNRETGSELKGPTLTYYREVVGLRDTSELFAPNRPTVHYRSEHDTAGAEPYVIVGDRVRLRGNSSAWMGGSVTVDRSDFGARSDSSTLDLDGARAPSLVTPKYGGRVGEYTLQWKTDRFSTQGTALELGTGTRPGGCDQRGMAAYRRYTRVRAARPANSGGLAWGDSTRPKAISQAYTITADSLALDAPDQQLREIRGYNKAFATAKTDSLVPEADWMSGDSLRAHFETFVTGQRMLSKLEGEGDARAFYHMVDPARPGPPGINYSRGTRITARFRPDGVDRIDVVGKADGVYLEPLDIPDSAAVTPPAKEPANP